MHLVHTSRSIEPIPAVLPINNAPHTAFGESIAASYIFARKVFGLKAKSKNFLDLKAAVNLKTIFFPLCLGILSE
jgi:hypothetical protein